MHADDLRWRGELDRWLLQPNNRSGKPGDDRAPAWRWLGYCYQDGNYLGIPSDNLMTTLREGGAKVPTGKKGQTYKRQSQSGIIIDQMQWSIQTSVRAHRSSIAYRLINSGSPGNCQRGLS